MAGSDSLQVLPYNDAMQKYFTLHKCKFYNVSKVENSLDVLFFGGLGFLFLPRLSLDLSLHIPEDANPLWPYELTIYVQFLGSYLMLASWYSRMAS
jgi:hypothetical protein